MALILLAAGRSSRFGRADKLAAPLGGRPLAAHAVAALAPLGFGHRLAVVSSPGYDFAAHGFECVAMPGGQPQSASLAAGIARAGALGHDACLVALADMPFVPTAHFRALVAGYRPPAIASDRQGRAMVPAILGSALWPDVLALSGDRGAGVLLADMPRIAAEERWLMDIDTPQDLARAEAMLARPPAPGRSPGDAA